jgi:copper binding plastocyanin/azurin family protein
VTTASIAEFSYTPSDIRIHAGDTVVWNNADPTVHTVTASRGEFASGSMGQGQTFAVRFNTPGVYPYFCEPHEFMRGNVSVLPATKRGPATDATSPTSVFVVTVPTTAAPSFVATGVIGHDEQPAALMPVVATLAAVVALVVGLRRLGYDALRVLAVIATLATGALHLQLRLVLDYPEPIGTLLVIEAGGAVVLAAWLAAGALTAHKRVVAIALHVTALLALGITRTSIGLFGFHEFGWDPSPQLPLALTLGGIAIAALVIGTVPRSEHASPAA